jgi:hypothetical protein
MIPNSFIIIIIIIINVYIMSLKSRTRSAYCIRPSCGRVSEDLKNPRLKIISVV